MFRQVMVKDPNRLVDGFLTAEGGVDSGFPPSLIQPNQLAWAVNATVRGGFPKTRPGWWKRLLNFGGNVPLQNAFEDGLFQGAGTYTSDSGIAYLAVSISGRIYLINVAAGFTVQDITIPGNPSQANLPTAWFCQAERWLIVQNGTDLPFLYDGTTSRRANTGGLNGGTKEVPIGGPMAYGKGRLWVAFGSQYYGGDLVWSTTAGRDSVIQFTENDFLNEGGAFAVANGPITGLAFGANIDTSLGDGDLLVFTALSVYAFAAPLDRETWKDLDYPIQRFALLNFGSVNQASIVPVNGDLFFRSIDGVRSMIYARRDFSEWGNTPISRQVHRALDYDTSQLLFAGSAVNFDNRILMTVQPQNVNNHGVYHRGLVVLDFDLVSGMGRKYPPAWEGVWTGVRVLQVITLRVGRQDRCFIFNLGDGDNIGLYEVTKDGAFDFDGTDDVATQWIIETRSVIFGDPLAQKRLMTADQWYDEVAGEITANVLYRPNENACWTPWAEWTDCAKYRDCEPGYPCQEIKYLQPASRSRMSLPQPHDTPDPQTGQFTRLGYEFQIRYEITGRLRMKRFVVVAQSVQENQYGNMTNAVCTTPPTGDCQTGCLEIQCTGYCSAPPDYSYTI
jgi:hypothetical protein